MDHHQEILKLLSALSAEQGERAAIIAQIEEHAASLNDMLTRLQTQEALPTPDERYRRLVENAPIGIYRTTPQGDILEANPALVRICGFPDRESMLAANATDLYHNPDRREELKQLIETEGEIRSCSWRVRRRDGSVIWVREASRAVRDEAGQVIYYEGTLEDISESKQAEEALRSSQKLAELGTLAAGIAHEINSPLQVITGLSERIDRQADNESIDPKELRSATRSIHRNSWRIAGIVRSLLTYARASSGDIVSNDLNEIVRDVMLLTHHQFSKRTHISIVTHLEEGLPVVHCDRAQISQALIHLLTNARDAMPKGGEIHITTSCQAEDEKLSLKITDTGTGIPQEHLARIFDPFFTTKEIGKGTGMGLAVVLGIINAHSGEIKVDSTPGEGTTFTLLLPLCPPDCSSEPTLGPQGRFDDGMMLTAS